MDSAIMQCTFHKEADLQFCMQHHISCCYDCHSGTNPDCTIRTTDDAADHFKKELERTAIKIDDVMQDCALKSRSLSRLHNDTQNTRGITFNSIVAFCNQLRSTIDKFETAATDEVRRIVSKQTEAITNQTIQVEQLSEFLDALKRKAEISKETQSATEPADRLDECHIQVSAFNDLRNRVAQLQDGMATARGRLERIDDLDKDDGQVIFHADRSVLELLDSKLSSIAPTIVKHDCSSSDRDQSNSETSLDCSITSVQQKVKNNTLAKTSDTESLLDDSVCSSEQTDFEPPLKKRALSDTSVIARPHVDLKGDRSLIRTALSIQRFTKISEFRYDGWDPAMCYIPNSPSHLLLATRPNNLFKLDENGKQLSSIVTKETPSDICLLGSDIYMTTQSGNIIVYDIAILTVNTLFSASGPCYGICSFGDDLAVTYPSEQRVRILSTSGDLLQTSSYMDYGPTFIAATSVGDRIAIISVDSDIIILSGDLGVLHMVTLDLEIHSPSNLCIHGDLVYAACEFTNTVIEVSIDGKYQRTLVTSADWNRWCSSSYPWSITYHSQARHLVVTSAAHPRKNNGKIFVLAGHL